MISLNEALQFTAMVGFALLFVLFGRRWLLTRVAAYGWLAVALASLVLVAAIGDAGTDEAGLWHLVSRVAFLGSGFALMMVRHSFVPVARGIRVGVLAASLVLAVLGGDAAPFYSSTARISMARFFEELGVVVLWSGCVAEAIACFWKASKGASRFQRLRLRSLSFAFICGFAMIVAAFVARTRGATPTEAALGHSLVVVLLPLMYFSVVPPNGCEERGVRKRRGSSALRSRSCSCSIPQRTLWPEERWTGRSVSWTRTEDSSFCETNSWNSTG